MLEKQIIQFLSLMHAFGWVILIPLIEKIFPKNKIQLNYRGVISDIFHTFDPFIKPTLVLFGVHALQWAFPQLAHSGLAVPASWPVWLHVPIIIFASELTFYWMHRLAHTSPLLWEFHRVHHSSTQFQSLMTSRFHPIDSSLFVIPYVFLVSVLALDPAVVYGFGLFQGLMDRYGHSNINGPRWTGYFLSNPHFHSWHHSTDLRAMNKNFSRDFVFFDYIFRTAFYPRNENPSEFGEPSYPVDFHIQFFRPFLECKKFFRFRKKYDI